MHNQKILPAVEKLKPKILIIDDSDDMRHMISLVLEQRGFETFEAGDATEAVAVILKNKIDLLIADYFVPGTTGVQIVSSITGLLGAQLPVIVVSSCDRPEIMRAANDAGLSTWIPKPVDCDHLVRTINAMLATKTAADL